MYGPVIKNIYYENYHDYFNYGHLQPIPTYGVISNEIKEILEPILIYARPLSTKKLRIIVKKSQLWYGAYNPNKKDYDIIPNDKILEYCQNYDKYKNDEKQLIKTKNQ